MIDRTAYAPASGLRQGAYVLADSGASAPDVILIATGSEVSIALDAHKRLEQGRHPGRVVSMPCCELFEQQPRSIETPCFLRRFALVSASRPHRRSGGIASSGPAASIVGVSHFGASAPGSTG